MTGVLSRIRGAVPASAREQVYTYVSAGVLLVAGLGYVSAEVAPLWIAAGVASVTLLFALLHSTSAWRTALYGVLAAVSPLALWYSLGTESGWAAVLAFASVVFGITKAAGKSVVVEGTVEDVRDVELVDDEPDGVELPAGARLESTRLRAGGPS